MKKSYILFLLLFSFVLLMPALPVLAQDSMTLTITPPLIKVNMLPGETWSSSIKVINNNKQAINLYTNVLDYKSGPDGGVQFLQDVYNNEADPSDYEQYRLSRWIEIEGGPIELGAQESMQFPFTISLPESAEPGGHYAAILVGTKPDAEVGGSAIKISSLLASLIMVNIKGDIIERGSIREFSTDKKYYRDADVKLAVRFENTGNVHLQPQGKVNIYDMFDNLRESISINHATDFGNVLPESVRRWDFEWKSQRGLLDTGKYKAMLILTYGEEARETVNQTIDFWVVDYYYLTAIVGGIILLILIIILLMRHYIRRAIRTTQKEAGYIMPIDNKRGGTTVIPKNGNGVDLRPSVKKRPIKTEGTQYKMSGWAVLKKYVTLSLVIVLIIGGAIFYFSKTKSTNNNQTENLIEDNSQESGGFTVLPPDENEDKAVGQEENLIAQEEIASTTRETEKPASSTDETATTTSKLPPDENEAGVGEEQVTKNEINFESITVIILNGSGVAGAAGRASSVLEEAGFSIDSTGNADNFNYTDTVVRYNKKYEREAEYMTGLLKGVVEMEPISEETDNITVIVGKNFN